MILTSFSFIVPPKKKDFLKRWYKKVSAVESKYQMHMEQDKFIPNKFSLLNIGSSKYKSKYIIAPPPFLLANEKKKKKSQVRLQYWPNERIWTCKTNHYKEVAEGYNKKDQGQNSIFRHNNPNQYGY